MFIAALFIIARTWKQPRCPSADEWIRKLWYIYTMDGLPCLPPGDLPNPGIKPVSLMLPALAGRFFTKTVHMS